MKLFQHSQGFIVAFGFDMVGRRPAPRLISWCDPVTKEWELATTNQAGTMSLSFAIDPEFVRECDGKIIAYQPGKCIEMVYIGQPYVFSFRTLQSDQYDAIAA